MSGVTQVDPEESNEDAFHRFISGSRQVGSPMTGTFGFLLKYEMYFASIKHKKSCLFSKQLIIILIILKNYCTRLFQVFLSPSAFSVINF